MSLRWWWTAQDGEATTTYTVTVTRAGSGDASLSALSLSGVTLSPVFASGTTAYTTSVVHAEAETTVDGYGRLRVLRMW